MHHSVCSCQAHKGTRWGGPPPANEVGIDWLGARNYACLIPAKPNLRAAALLGMYFVGFCGPSEEQPPDPLLN